MAPNLSFLRASSSICPRAKCRAIKKATAAAAVDAADTTSVPPTRPKVMPAPIVSTEPGTKRRAART
jgi:hypothetical protein